MRSVFDKSKELEEKTQQGRERMIRSELLVANSSCDLAETESRIGNIDRLPSLVRDAERALHQIRKRLNEVELEGREKDGTLDEVEDIGDRLEAVDPDSRKTTRSS